MYTITKIKLLLAAFSVAYSVFFTQQGFALYQDLLSDFISYDADDAAHDLVKSVMDLNKYKNIDTNFKFSYLPNRTQIFNTYNKLGILDYNDYIYGFSNDFKMINYIWEKGWDLNNNKSKVSFQVLNDIVYKHNDKIINDYQSFGEDAFGKLFHLSLPLIASTSIIAAITIIENLSTLVFA